MYTCDGWYTCFWLQKYIVYIAIYVGSATVYIAVVPIILFTNCAVESLRIIFACAFCRACIYSYIATKVFLLKHIYGCPRIY